jgi:tetratricopeptide (TPR) repeat protein
VKSRFAIYLVACAALLAYGNSAFHGFVYDDDLTVAECPLIASWSHLGDLLTQDYFTQTIEMSWRPVVTLTLFVDHSLFGDIAFGYHLMSVLWHLAAALALWGMIRALLGQEIGAVIAATVFAVHPLGSEAVNAISFREDLLVGLFAPLAVSMGVLWVRAERTSWPALVGSALCFLAACLAKESGAVIPLLIALWLWLRPREVREPRRLWLLGAVHLATGALWALLRFVLIVPANPTPVPPWGGSAVTAVWNFPRIFFHGLALVIFPSGLSADYEWRALAFGHSPLLWLGWAGIALWLGAIVALRRRWPAVAFGMGWWIIALLPVSNVVPLSNPVADRYMYVPLMGLAVASAGGIEWVRQSRAFAQPRLQRVALGVAAAAALLLMHVTVNRNLVWGDAERLWTAALEVEPNSTTALNNLGCIRLSQGRASEAAALLERGLAVAPQDEDLVNNYGIAMAELGSWDEARRAFEWSVQRNPGDRLTHWRLALCLARSSQPDLERAWQEMLTAERMGHRTPPDFREALAHQITGGEAS